MEESENSRDYMQWSKSASIVDGADDFLARSRELGTKQGKPDENKKATLTSGPQQ